MCLAGLCTASAIEAERKPVVAIGSIFRTKTGDRRVPHYGLQGVLRVVLCGINGPWSLILHFTRKVPTNVATGF